MGHTLTLPELALTALMLSKKMSYEDVKAFIRCRSDAALDYIMSPRSRFASFGSATRTPSGRGGGAPRAPQASAPPPPATANMLTPVVDMSVLPLVVDCAGWNIQVRDCLLGKQEPHEPQEPLQRCSLPWG